MSRRFQISAFFQEVQGSLDEWRCTCGKTLKRRKGSGWTNLVNHLNAQHPGWDYDKAQQSIDSTGATTSKVVTIYSWMEWICVSMKPFTFCTDPLTRKYSKLENISVNTLKKYMDLTVKHVEGKISRLLPEQFALILDAWSSNSVHYLAVFASFPDDSPTGFSCVLLGFSSLLSETNFTAGEHKKFLEWMLTKVYDKSLANVVAIIGDNAPVNKAVADLCETGFIGCASHRFNLAINTLMEKWR